MIATIEELQDCFYKLFPTFTPRENQLEIALEVIIAFESGIKHVILDAPTGSGKSIILGIVFEWYSQREMRCVATTVTKALQSQYQRDFDFYDIRGSSNEIYRCKAGHVRSDLECTVHSSKAKCKNKHDCPYGTAINNFMHGRKALTNLQFFTKVPYLNNPYLVGIDECHTLAQIVSSQIEISYVDPNFELLRFVVREKFAFDELQKHLTKTKKILSEISKGNVFDFPDLELAIRASLILDTWITKTSKTAEALMNAVPLFKKAFKHAKSIKNMLDPLTVAKGELFVSEGDLKFSPVYASSFTEKMIFRKAHKFLHMSATICGFTAYCEEIGIDPAEAKFISANHMIPIDKREIYTEVAAYMSFKNYDDGIVKSALKIDQLIERHDFKNTIIHTASYKRADDIAEKSKFDIVVPRSHFEAIELLKSAPTGIYVASPSLVAGVDAKDDMCRLNIIAKVPYPSLASPKIKYLSKAEPRLYALAVARDLVQASGRSTRHEEDWSITYVIDGQFRNFLKYNQNVLPMWFRQSIKSW